MKRERKFLDAIADVPDEMIEETEKRLTQTYSAKSKKRLLWLLPAVACLLLFAGAILWFALPGTRLQKKPKETPRLQAAAPIMEVSMPETYAFDDSETRWKIRDENPVEESFTEGLRTFSYETASALLAEGEENVNYSPLSLYYALALAATGAEGETKEELLALLHVPDTDTLAAQCGNFFRLSYQDNEIGIRKIANSLWMDKDTAWKQGFIEGAAKNFYSSVFSMDLGSEEAAAAMSAWISEQTNGSLAPALSPDEESVLRLINTVTFHDEWVDRFNKEKTKPDSFTLSDGSSVTCDFMNRTYDSHGFSLGDGYTRSSLSLKNNTMVFILPDEGVSPQSLVDTPEKMREAFEGGEDYMGEVVWQVPKFDFASSLDLKETLNHLGVSSAFGADADFSGITDDAAFLSGVTQGTHIAVNEDGVDASAFTMIDYAGAAMPEGRADMRLTRPFLYGIIGPNGSLLFVGICENPTAN